MEKEAKLYTMYLTEEEKNYLTGVLKNNNVKLDEDVEIDNSSTICDSIKHKLEISEQFPTTSWPTTTDMSAMYDVVKTMYLAPKNVVLDTRELPDDMTKDQVINTFKESGVLVVKSMKGKDKINSYVVSK